MNWKMWREIARGTRFLLFFITIVLSVPGIFIQYCILTTEAAQRKWEVFRQVDGDLCCYIGDVAEGEQDPLRDEIHTSFTSYQMCTVNVNKRFSVYQYSEEAWRFFHYPLSEGDDFSSLDVNEVIVCPALGAAYPVGTEIKIPVYAGKHRDSEQLSQTLTCRVVGVLQQDEIIFPYRNAGTQDYSLWNTNMYEKQSSLTANSLFMFLNPRAVIEDSDSCYESQGVFFDRGSGNDPELAGRLEKEGILVSMRELYEKNKPSMEISAREYTAGAVLLLFGVVCLVVLAHVVSKKHGEDIIFYLERTGYSEKGKFRCLCGLNAVILLAAWCLSMGAYGMSGTSEYEHFWQPVIWAPFAALAGYAIIWLVSSMLIRSGDCN